MTAAWHPYMSNAMCLEEGKRAGRQADGMCVKDSTRLITKPRH